MELLMKEGITGKLKANFRHLEKFFLSIFHAFKSIKSDIFIAGRKLIMVVVMTISGYFKMPTHEQKFALKLTEVGLLGSFVNDVRKNNPNF